MLIQDSGVFKIGMEILFDMTVCDRNGKDIMLICTKDNMVRKHLNNKMQQFLKMLEKEVKHLNDVCMFCNISKIFEEHNRNTMYLYELR
jgi:hypothetical protein